MKKMKSILSILLVCVMLMAVLPMTVSAAGTQDDPINANDKWFGYGTDCYLLNPTLTEGNVEGIWYTFTAEQNGIPVLEHSYKNVDYTICITLNGVSYLGGCDDGEPYNRPIVTAPIEIGDKALIQIVTEDAAAGTIYANLKIVTGASDDAIKMKSNGAEVVVGAGETVYFQDDSLNAIYATKGLWVYSADGVADTTFYNATVNSTSGATTLTAVTDTDGDSIIEATLGGSLGSAGAPPVKPMWAIENNSTENLTYSLRIQDEAHECNWDDDTDADCNACGAIREVATPCEHAYDNECDADCNLCGQTREAPHCKFACSDTCDLCLTTGLSVTEEHQYDNPFDYDCNTCGGAREAVGITYVGSSISPDVTGLAMQFTIPVEGMTKNGTTAVYDNATIGGYKLVGMGAVVSNQGDDHYDIEDADGIHVTHIPAMYLCGLTEDSASFAIRVINIPEEGKDTLVRFRSYFIYEDKEGVQHTVYSSSASGAYSWY